MSVFIIDDNPIMTKGLVALFGENNIESNEIKSLEELISGSTPSLSLQSIVLIQEQMINPKMDWFKTECLEKLDFRFVCVLNERNTERHRNLIQVGFSGVILNNDVPDLLNCIKCLKKHPVYIQEEYLSLFVHPSVQHRRQLSSPDAFNSREEAILKLMFDEYSTKEIGSKLSLSSRTVEWHRKRMMEKSGARNMIGLIRYGLENRLLEVPSAAC